MADQTTITVTLKDVYDELRKLHDQVATMTPQAQLIQDHEARLRRTERWLYALPPSLLLALASLIVALLGRHQ